MLTKLATSFAEILANLVVAHIVEKNVVAKINELDLKRNVASVIKSSLMNAISNFPNSEYIFENFDCEAFFERPRVKSEISHIFEPWEKIDSEVLYEEWVEIAGSQNIDNLLIVLRLFISALNDQLYKIPEISELLHIKETHEDNGRIREIKDIVVGISDKITSFSVSSLATIPDSASVAEKEISAKVDVLSRLYKEGKPNACLYQAREIERIFEDLDISNKLRARILSLIAGCYLSLDEPVEALTYSRRAYQIDEKTPEIIADYSLCLLDNEDVVDAERQARIALTIKPDLCLAGLVLFVIQTTGIKAENIDKYINEAFLGDPEYLRVIGITYLNANEIGKSEYYLRKSLAIKPNDIYAVLSLLSLLIEKKLPNFLKRAGDNQQLIFMGIVDEVKQLSDLAYDLAQSLDNELLKKNILVSNAGIKASFGDFGGAKTILDFVLQNDQSNLLALHNRALLAFQENDYKAAVDFIDRIPFEYQVEHHLIMPLVYSMIELGYDEKVFQLLEKLEVLTTDVDYFNYLSAKAILFIKRGKLEEAKEIRATILAKSQGNFRAFAAAGDIAKKLNNASDTVVDYTQSYDLAEYAKDKDIIANLLGEFYFNHHDYLKASGWYEKIDIGYIYLNNLTTQYATSLYYSRDYAKTYEFINKCLVDGYSTPQLLMIQSWLAEYFGDLPEAIKIYSELLSNDPENTKYKIELARLYFWNNEREKADDIINSIHLLLLQDPWEMIKAAELLSVIGNHLTAIQLAYHALKKNINIAEFHIAYISIFMKAEGEIDLDCPVVKENSAIRLENDFGAKWITLLAVDFPSNEENMEYAVSSIQGRLLLGHIVGDVIKMREGPLEREESTITAIQSIYIRAFQDISENFGVRFPNDYSIQRMPIIDGDFTNLFQQILRQNTREEFVEKHYSQGLINLEQFAKLVGKDPITIFMALHYQDESRIFASSGSSEEQEHQYSVALNSEQITLDLSGLLTLKYLEILELLPKVFTVIYVSQRLVDSIKKALLDLDIERIRGRKIIGYNKDHFFMEETPIAIILNTITFLEILLEFLKTKCIVLPISIEYADYLKDVPIDEYFGEVGISTILIAKQKGTAIYSNDFSFRKNASTKFHINSFWIQDLLKVMLARRIIQDSEYVGACASLAMANYFFVSLNADLIFKVLNLDNFQLTKRIDAILRTFQLREADKDRKMAVSVLLLKKLWMERILPTQKSNILYRILDYLTKGEIRDEIIEKLRNALRIELSIAVVQAKDIDQEILRWRAFHPVKGNLVLGRREL